MRGIALLVGTALLSACASEVPTKTPAWTRLVHSGDKNKIGYYYSISPACESSGDAEITIIKPPGHGKASWEKGEEYPNYPRDNVRWECNKRLLPAVILFYQSDPGFQGNDSLNAQVRYPGYSTVKVDTYQIEVR